MRSQYRRTAFIVALAVAAGPPGAAGDVTPAKKEAEPLQGTWRIYFVGKPDDGAGGPFDPQEQDRLVVKGPSFSVTDKAGGKARGAGMLRLNSAKDPWEADLTFADGPAKGKTYPGVVMVDGETLKLCLGHAGGKRPAGFKPADGGVLMLLLEPVKD